MDMSKTGAFRDLLVYNEYGSLSYPKDFDRNKEYEFTRDGWDAPARFRLADQSPYCNVWGLRFREIS